MAYHSWAPTTAMSLNRVHRLAHMLARHSAQRLFSVVYSGDLRLPGTQRDSPEVFASTSYVRVVDLYVTLPPQITHLCCAAIGSFESDTEAQADHKIDVTTGALTDTGAVVTVRSAGQADLYRQRHMHDVPSHLTAELFSPFGGANSFVTLCEVALANVAADQDVNIRVYGRAIYVGGTIAMPYRPQLYLGWWEAR
jgi:hypothetical protein